MRIRQRHTYSSPSRRATAMVATLAIVSAAFTAVLLIATAPSAMAIPAPPGESWSPPLTGGPAGQPCAGVTVLCVGPGLTYTTIGAAIAAADPAATIQVQAGTYPENLSTTRESLTILGGFPANSWTTRDPEINVTTIDGQQLGSVITVVGCYRRHRFAHPLRDAGDQRQGIDGRFQRRGGLRDLGQRGR